MQPYTINFAGVVADRQSFLDGARTYTIEAEDQPRMGWRLLLAFHWDVEGEAVDEGDLTLVDPMANELYATLREGSAAEITDETGAANAAQFDLKFDVTGGEAGYAGARGTVNLTGTIAGEGAGTGGSFEGPAGEAVMLTAQMQIEGAEGAWTAPPEQDIPTGPPRPGEPGG